jgi:hypothetical protein
VIPDHADQTVRSVDAPYKVPVKLFIAFVLYTATLITAKAVIPAPYQVRGKLQQGTIILEALDSPVSSTGQAQSSPE